MNDIQPNRRSGDSQMHELKDMMMGLSVQIGSLSSRLEQTEERVAELVTYLERGKGIWWLFKVGLALTPIVTSVVAGIWWIFHNLKP